MFMFILRHFVAGALTYLGALLAQYFVQRTVTA